MKYKELIKFGIVGTFSTIINLIVYTVFLSFETAIELSAIFGYISGLSVSFSFNKFWVFKKVYSNKTAKQLVLFTSLYLFSLCIHTVIISILEANLGTMIPWLIGILLSTIINFTGAKLIVFK